MNNTCGTCKQFILGKDDYFVGTGECKDRATVDVGSNKCKVYEQNNLFKILITYAIYRVRKYNRR